MSQQSVRIGVQLQPQHATYDQIRAAIAEVEHLGVDIAFNWDHFYPLYGKPDGPHFECWSMLAAWAEQTSRIEFGALVSCNSYRNPDLLADMARTIDHISDGRLIFGIGSGWFERDYDEYGYEFGTPGGRLDALAQALPRIENRWAHLNPAPLRKIPVLIGGGGEKKTLRMVAKHASIWHSFSDPQTFARKSAILADWCQSEGTDFSQIERSVEVGGGAPDSAATDDYLAAGAGLLTIAVGGPAYDLSTSGTGSSGATGSTADLEGFLEMADMSTSWSSSRSWVSPHTAVFSIARQTTPTADRPRSDRTPTRAARCARAHWSACSRRNP